MRTLVLLASLVGLLVAGSSSAAADPGDPVAVRRFGDDTVRIETMWGLRVVIAPAESMFRNSTPPALADGVDLLIYNGAAEGNQQGPVYAFEEGRALDVIVDRLPNSPRVSTAFGVGDFGSLSTNSVRVRWFGEGAEWGHYLIEADGVTIAYAPTAFNGAPPAADVVMGPALSFDRIMPNGVRYMVPMDGKSEYAGPGREPVGNTFAVSMHREPKPDSVPMVVHLKAQPWTMPKKLAELFAAKEADAAASMAVFAPMITAQMNHKPANGTHTPRWNVEHMTGTELGFFSGVYANLDPELRPINRRPAQMPPQYEAREPSWTGAEEARQIERSQAYTRRFAYLLDGMPLDELPQGAPRLAKSLGGLFGLMSNHYPEHTAHVVEKTQQPDWPAK